MSPKIVDANGKQKLYIFGGGRGMNCTIWESNYTIPNLQVLELKPFIRFRNLARDHTPWSYHNGSGGWSSFIPEIIWPIIVVRDSSGRFFGFGSSTIKYKVKINHTFYLFRVGFKLTKNGSDEKQKFNTFQQFFYS